MGSLVNSCRIAAVFAAASAVAAAAACNRVPVVAALNRVTVADTVADMMYRDPADAVNIVALLVAANNPGIADTEYVGRSDSLVAKKKGVLGYCEGGREARVCSSYSGAATVVVSGSSNWGPVGDCSTGPDHCTSMVLRSNCRRCCLDLTTDKWSHHLAAYTRKQGAFLQSPRIHCCRQCHWRPSLHNSSPRHPQT